MLESGRKRAEKRKKETTENHCIVCGAALESTRKKYCDICLKEQKKKSHRAYQRKILLPSQKFYCEKCGKELKTTAKKFSLCLACREAEKRDRQEKEHLEKQKADVCRSCRYWRPLSGTAGIWYACHYCLDNGKSRPKDPKQRCLGFAENQRTKRTRNITICKETER